MKKKLEFRLVNPKFKTGTGIQSLNQSLYCGFQIGIQKEGENLESCVPFNYLSTIHFVRVREPQGRRAGAEDEDHCPILSGEAPSVGRPCSAAGNSFHGTNSIDCATCSGSPCACLVHRRLSMTVCTRIEQGCGLKFATRSLLKK